jgi:hypothetical protein
MDGEAAVQSSVQRLQYVVRAIAPGAHPRGAWVFFVTQLLAVVLLQRIVVPGLAVEIILFTFAAGIAGLCLFGEVTVCSIRVFLFSAFAVSICLSSLLAGREVSVTSIALLLAGYSSYVIMLNVTREFYLRCIDFFVGVMIVVAFITVIQIGGQAATGRVLVPSMDGLLPNSLIIQGYVYWQTIYWGAELIKPPAFFFREVSFVSQFLALAIVAEIAFFRRIWRLVILIIALFATFAGTGLLILAVTSPFLLAKLPRTAKLYAIPLVAVGAMVLVASGWFSNVEYRLGEYEDTSSSTYGRFIYPVVALSQLEEFGNPVLTGMGAGNADRATKGNGVLAAPTKLLLEYGIVPAILFYIFLIYCLFYHTPDISFSFALLAVHVLGGGYLLVTPYIILLFILGVIFRIPEQQTESLTVDRMAGHRLRN